MTDEETVWLEVHSLVLSDYQRLWIPYNLLGALGFDPNNGGPVSWGNTLGKCLGTAGMQGWGAWVESFGSVLKFCVSNDTLDEVYKLDLLFYLRDGKWCFVRVTVHREWCWNESVLAEGMQHADVCIALHYNGLLPLVVHLSRYPGKTLSSSSVS